MIELLLIKMHHPIDLKLDYMQVQNNVIESYERRHSRWYEVILLNFWFQFFCGAIFIVLLPHYLRWPHIFLIYKAWNVVQTTSLYANATAFFIAFISLQKIQQFPGARSANFILPTLLVSWLLVIVFLFFTRGSYARSVLAISFLFANLWAFIVFFISRKYYIPKIAIVPFGRTQELKLTHNPTEIVFLEIPILNRRYDAVVVDLHADMPPEWQRFLAQCALSRIPVYHIRQLLEKLTGRVKVSRLSENIFGVLQPSPLYEPVKRILEITLILLTFPIWGLILIIASICIKLESSGPIFYCQERVGYKRKIFQLYKLRSMYITNGKTAPQFAKTHDKRITKVGGFIRKTRIDEIPQFFNILKGDMSLIGPRPEQRAFVDQFEKEIPFYSYRHVVRPGITGWAQVTQGYVANADETRLKLEHDFYYIKHFSFWLDLLIFFKTIKTMMTGFGSR